MKIKLFIIFALMAVSAASASDDASVDGLYLSHQNNETVLKIDVSGSYQFSHQTAEATADKPFRIVVDVFPAIHGLPQKSYEELPKSIISTVRTSQYSVDPDKVVRVVCDIDETVMYRIEKKDKYVCVYIPDKNSENFAAWSSESVKPPVIASTSDVDETGPEVKKVKVEPVKRIQTASKKVSTTATTVEKPKVVVAEKSEENAIVKEPVSTPPVKYYRPEKSDTIDRDKALTMLTPAPSKEAPEAEKNQPKKSSTPIQKPKAGATVDKAATVPAKKEIVSTPNNNVPPQNTSTPTPKPESPKEIASSPKESTSDDSAETKQSTELADAKSKDKKPTSRFRRKPAFPTKLKGTIVAEFPKRMVIKYKPGTAKDPFKNLLTVKKTDNHPTQKKIPDVETTRLVGVLESSSGEKRALLEDLEGYGYILKTGDKIKKGYVERIDADKAFFRLFEYGWSRTVALYLGIN